MIQNLEGTCIVTVRILKLFSDIIGGCDMCCSMAHQSPSMHGERLRANVALVASAPADVHANNKCATTTSS